MSLNPITKNIIYVIPSLPTGSSGPTISPIYTTPLVNLTGPNGLINLNLPTGSTGSIPLKNGIIVNSFNDALTIVKKNISQLWYIFLYNITIRDINLSNMNLYIKGNKQTFFTNDIIANNSSIIFDDIMFNQMSSIIKGINNNTFIINSSINTYNLIFSNINIAFYNSVFNINCTLTNFSLIKSSSSNSVFYNCILNLKILNNVSSSITMYHLLNSVLLINKCNIIIYNNINLNNINIIPYNLSNSKLLSFDVNVSLTQHTPTIKINDPLLSGSNHLYLNNNNIHTQQLKNLYTSNLDNSSLISQLLSHTQLSPLNIYSLLQSLSLKSCSSNSDCISGEVCINNSCSTNILPSNNPSLNNPSLNNPSLKNPSTNILPLSPPLKNPSTDYSKNIRHLVPTTSSDKFVLTSSDHTILADTKNFPVTIEIPNFNLQGKIFVIRKLYNSKHPVIIKPLNSSIEGYCSIILGGKSTQPHSIWLQYSNNQWYVIS